MLHAIATVVALLVGVAVYFVNDLLGKRRQLNGLPQPPMKNILVGHLHIADECRLLFPDDAHPHTWPQYIRSKYDLPETFYVDWRPFGPLWLFTCDPVLISRNMQTLPKAMSMVNFLNRFLGDKNLVSIHGPHWKSLRSMFNPGFSAANLMTLADYIVDASVTFADILRQRAETNELFELEEDATRLTIEIIGKASLDADMPAQKGVIHPIVQLFRERVVLMPPGNAIFPWQAINPLRPFNLWWNRRKMDAAISHELDLKIRRRARELELEDAGSTKTRKRSVLDLALSSYENELLLSQRGSTSSGAIPRITDASQLPQSLKSDIIDSVKTFIFAGHDTTSSTICWILYLLHQNPRVQEKLTAELDSVFPPGTSAAEKIKEDPYIVNNLQYANAIMNETMRIFPPASTLRFSPNGQVFVDSRGQQFPTAGVDIWPLSLLLNRNTRFFPEPTKFIPERFIPSETPFPDAELFTDVGKDAFRPFERGPRNCIGQELARLETKIIMALIVREFDFVVEFPGEEPDVQFPIPESTAAEFTEESEYGRGIHAGTVKKDRIEGHRLYQTLSGSAKPVGRCPGRIKLRTRN